MILINITNTHWILACVFLEEKRVQIYDSLPDKMDGQQYWLDQIKQYLTEEYRHRHKRDLPGADEWVYKTCPFRNRLAPKQCKGSNDCGVYLCFFMELLMNGLMPKLLIGLERKVTKYGRDALWGAIQGKRPFLSMVTTPYLHLFMNADVAYIEELAFHYYDNQEKTEKRSLPLSLIHI